MALVNQSLETGFWTRTRWPATSGDKVDPDAGFGGGDLEVEAEGGLGRPGRAVRQ